MLKTFERADLITAHVSVKYGIMIVCRSCRGITTKETVERELDAYPIEFRIEQQLALKLDLNLADHRTERVLYELDGLMLNI